jgi:uncharacterized phage protein (TIGR02220 family)
MTDQKDVKKAVDTLIADTPFLWGYTAQDNGIWETDKINTNEKIVYMAINSKVNSTSEVAFPSYNKLAKMTGLSKPTVIKCVKGLVDIGLLIKKEIAYNSNRYTIKMIQQCSEQLGFTQDSLIERIEKKKKVDFGQLMESLGDDHATDEPGEQPEEKKPKADSIPYMEIITYLNERAGKRFVHTVEKHRKDIKARYNELKKAGMDHETIISEFKRVIDVKVHNWKGKTFNINGKLVSADKYLQPSTLFGSKFDNYRNEEIEDQKQSPGSQSGQPGQNGVNDPRFADFFKE